jgi:hypothetical protein
MMRNLLHVGWHPPVQANVLIIIWMIIKVKHCLTDRPTWTHTHYALLFCKYVVFLFDTITLTFCFQCPSFFQMVHILVTRLPIGMDSCRQSIQSRLNHFPFYNNWLAKIEMNGKGEKNYSNTMVPQGKCFAIFQQTIRSTP